MPPVLWPGYSIAFHKQINNIPGTVALTKMLKGSEEGKQEIQWYVFIIDEREVTFGVFFVVEQQDESP